MGNFFENFNQAMDTAMPAETVPEAITEHRQEITDEDFKQIEASWDPEKVKTVDEQLKTEQFVEVSGPDGKPIRMETRFIDPSPGIKEGRKKTVVVFAGWGGGWDSLEGMAKTLALDGERRVALITMPGVGKSDDSPDAWLKENNFNQETDALLQAAEQLRRANGDENDEISLIGYSMGGLLAAEAAKKNPKLVKNLVLMHSAGVKKESPLSLMARFAGSGGAELVRQVKGLAETGFRSDWVESAADHLNIGDKIFRKGVFGEIGMRRIKQHFYKELKALAEKGPLLPTVEEVEANILAISGGGEVLFSKDEAEQVVKSAKKSKRAIASVMGGGEHASPMAKGHDMKYAININHWLDAFDKEDAPSQEK